jgi:hypothetical protein
MSTTSSEFHFATNQSDGTLRNLARSEPGLRRLVVRSEVEGEESLLGLLVRLSALNKFDHPGWIVNQYESPPHGYRFALQADLDDLARVTGLDLSVLQAISYRKPGGKSIHENVMFRGHEIQGRFLDLRWPKVCPACLSARAILPAFWELALWVCCPVHNCFLVSQCPRCKTDLSWRRACPEVCACGASLTAIASDAAPTAVQEFMLLLAAAVGASAPGTGQHSALPRSVFHSLIGHLSPQELMHFVLFIGTEPTPLVRNRGTLFDNARASREISSLVGRAATVLADWPRAFHTLIASSRGVRQNAKGPISEFGRTVNYLQRILSSTQFDFARAELDAYLRSDWNANFEKSGATRYTALRDARAEYFSARQAARQLGYHIVSVRARVISGEIPGHVIWKRGHARYFVERKWIAATLQTTSEQGGTKPSIILKNKSPPSLPDFLAADISAHQLGTHIGQLHQLATEGLITRSADTHAFEHSSLTNLLKRLEVVANELDQGQTKTALLDIAAAGSRYRPLTLSRILKEALAGKLPIFFGTGFSESGLRRFAVPYDLLRRMQLDLQLHEADRMSYWAAAQILQCSLHTIRTLLDLELLTQRQSTDGRPERYRTLLGIEVRKLANDYVFARPLRERFGVNFRAHLAKLEVFPVINIRASPRGLRAWNRAEIESVGSRLREGLMSSDAVHQ